jgi:hypothetical protein
MIYDLNFNRVSRLTRGNESTLKSIVGEESKEGASCFEIASNSLLEFALI